ncbi:50S ribosomal protein L11 methyltransferase [Novosphingobium lentum]|uniref:50S ribosomal protein L11 methyltransferase n=1 Tax=Novosphingobium lentum TaxID=145287 RepID=UPI0008373D47|nr:50S ribosomal protein L11 methyltransferase [Novosphingobium lentum]
MSADESWKITALAPREVVQAALIAHEDAFDWSPDIVIGGSEVAEDRPDDWQLEAWLPRKPKAADRAAFAALFGADAPAFTVEKLPPTDWVTLSQHGVEPIREGPFHVHTPDYPALNAPGVRDFLVPASRAFGTGQHATTAGCLAMLTHIRAEGAVVRNLADIGTGTGLLAFAALHLWPRALATASDIDPVCVPVVLENAAANGIATGGGAGQLAMAVAEGMDHPLLASRAPFDLLIANILAGPLVELAPAFADAVVAGGSLVLAGLLETQEPAVRMAYRRAGFRLAARVVRGDWSILWLRRRGGGRSHNAGRQTGRPQRW